MSRTIKVALSPASFKSAAADVRKYQKGLQEKCQMFVELLAELGIQVATRNTGAYGEYITFSTELTSRKSGAKIILMESNSGIIKSEWRTEDGVKTADVSPMLMAEFGAGLKANNPRAGEFGMGTGTFPGQKHATDAGGWWWMDLEEHWHHTSGITPTMPMFKAALEMERNVIKAAKEVFGG